MKNKEINKYNVLKEIGASWNTQNNFVRGGSVGVRIPRKAGHVLNNSDLESIKPSGKNYKEIFEKDTLGNLDYLIDSAESFEDWKEIRQLYCEAVEKGYNLSGMNVKFAEEYMKFSEKVYEDNQKKVEKRQKYIEKLNKRSNL